jgi:hypothetical protein
MHIVIAKPMRKQAPFLRAGIVANVLIVLKRRTKTHKDTDNFFVTATG